MIQLVDMFRKFCKNLQKIICLTLKGFTESNYKDVFIRSMNYDLISISFKNNLKFNNYRVIYWKFPKMSTKN